MKKFFAILLAVCLVAGLLPVVAFAADANPARFVFVDSEEKTAPGIEVLINQGDAPVYLRTVGKVATKEGATESNYNIMVTYNAGETPKLYLKGAELSTYGDGDNVSAITIGSKNPEDACNDLDVEIVIQKNSVFTHKKVYGASQINSYITGTLTFSREKGTLAMWHMMNQGPASINAVGDIVLKANITMQSSWSGLDRANYICSEKGSITVDGGNLTITTNSDNPSASAAARRVLMADGDITIQNGAKVKITMEYSGKIFGTQGEVIIKDSTVTAKVTSENGTIFNISSPLIEGYAGGYTALGDEAAYNEDNFDLLKSFSVEPVGAEEPTEPATQPSTEPATQPTTPATQPTTPVTQPTIPATEPSAPAAQPTTPSDTDNQPKNNINTIILVVALAVILLGGAAIAVIIVKRKDQVVEIIEEVIEEKTEE